jgi:hypothetical protein
MALTNAGPRRRPWLRRLAVAGPPIVLLAAVGVAGVVQLVQDRDSPPEESCTTPAGVRAGKAGPATQAPSGGGLQIAEKGFTQMGVDADTVSVGVVLENVSSQVAYRTRITFRLFDDQRRSVTPPTDDKRLSLEVPVIFPHQRVVAGKAQHIDEARSGTTFRVAGFNIDLGDTQWLSPNDAKRSLAQTSIDSQRARRLAEDSGDVVFTLRSAYCRVIPLRGVALVFRNSAGVVVGGSFDAAPPGGYCRPGVTEDELAMALEGMPRDADLTKTEVSPYCDISRPTLAPSESDAPIN